ncbi:MAG: hypothetical protein CVV27_14845 [Candidatus Melainabacteria bacterium HGW-Melainabacteria-1]|nr:MAG: hypothetical protein CVV27_14845 [Candidatus Melainabacteria bacterium HGW-Melainabacteria-1]
MIIQAGRVGFLLMALVACGSVPTTGSLAFRLNWQPGFQLQAIPAGTETLHILVRAGEQVEVDERLQQAGNLQRSYQLGVGPKQLQVRALNAGGEILAESDTQIAILPGRNTEAKLSLEPTQPEPETIIGGGGGSGNGNGGGGGGEDTGNGSDGSGSTGEQPNTGPVPNPNTSPNASPDPNPVSSPSASAGSSGGGGGGGSVSTGRSVTISGLVVDPETLAGNGHVARLLASVSDPDSVALATDYVWTCTDASNNPCAAPVRDSQNPAMAYWTAPIPANLGPYTLKLVIAVSGHPPQEISVQVNVMQNSGDVTTDTNQGGQA